MKQIPAPVGAHFPGIRSLECGTKLRERSRDLVYHALGQQAVLIVLLTFSTDHFEKEIDQVFVRLQVNVQGNLLSFNVSIHGVQDAFSE